MGSILRDLDKLEKWPNAMLNKDFQFFTSQNHLVLVESLEGTDGTGTAANQVWGCQQIQNNPQIPAEPMMSPTPKITDVQP
ncbi:hypothetical protein DUI87_17948 [Hirundo rustica rustica]|uniref:Uncharacterized protein n=1 Tax=Hirundo rustica rustica TaxID=333673 RepID=A0A3M0JUU8_HIRRU|nr:hypothetical protein DUI87_17948 [Hirundo rustica rustica]